MPFTMSNGVRLAYDEAGAAGARPAVVLTHGGLADRRMWDHQFQALAEHGRVVRTRSRPR
jgi:pimeloyl-ACP methyl ester carboxylesterase